MQSFSIHSDILNYCKISRSVKIISYSLGFLNMLIKLQKSYVIIISKLSIATAFF